MGIARLRSASFGGQAPMHRGFAPHYDRFAPKCGVNRPLALKIRPGRDLHPCIEVLQTSALLLGYLAEIIKTYPG